MISVAVGHWYPNGVRRQHESLIATGTNFNQILHWIDRYPPGSPTHQQTMYAFKPYAAMEAIRRGYNIILWLDASCWAIRNIQPIFDHIEQHGYLVFQNGYTVGQWSTDAYLNKIGWTRDFALTVPDTLTGCIGFDARTEIGKQFFNEWYAAANDGVSFNGCHTNEHGECSPDKRCLGHRHDQTVASVLVHQMGLTATACPKFFALSSGADKTSMIVAEGL